MKSLQDKLTDSLLESQHVNESRFPKSFATPQELAEAISKITGYKVKRVPRATAFKDYGGYGASTIVEDVYEVAFDEESKCQIGTAVRHTKDWMGSVPGEIVIRTATKKTTISGKKTFQWNSDAISSYKPGSDFEEYLHTTSHIQSTLFKSIM